MTFTPGFRFRPMTEQDAASLCEWRYPPPYERFNWPSWDEMRARMTEFGDPDIRARQYAAVSTASDPLVGYAQFFPMDRVVRLGLGLRPDLCGRGWGAAFARAIAAEAARRHPETDIDLEVETINERAIRAYRRAGFVVDDAYARPSPTGDISVLCLLWKPDNAGRERQE